MRNIFRRYIREITLGVCLFVLPFVLPSFGVSTDVGTLVTAAGTIFAVVAGFFIADAMSNYLRLQTLIAEENSALITIADNAKQIDAKGFIDVHQAIDEYLIVQLDSGSLDHFSQTQKQVDQLHKSIHGLPINADDGVLVDHVLSMEEKIMTSRQEMALAAKKTLTVGHWMTLIALAVLVAITVLAIRDGTLFTNAVAGLMIVGTQAVMIVLRDVDNNRLLERKLAYQNPREVFHAIARPPYYPYFSDPRARVPNAQGVYRLGRKGETSYDTVSVGSPSGTGSGSACR